MAGVAAIAALAYVALRPDPLAITVTDIQPVTTEEGKEILPAQSPGAPVGFLRRTRRGGGRPGRPGRTHERLRLVDEGLEVVEGGRRVPLLEELEGAVQRFQERRRVPGVEGPAGDQRPDLRGQRLKL